MYRCSIENESAIMQEAARLLKQSKTANGRRAAFFAAARDEGRRNRSLQTCHRYAHEKPRHAPPKDTGAYVPAMAARIENDRNLTDGARRCARKLVEEAYRRNRDCRALPVTVSYLGRALGKCRRTVQRYLRQLEAEGYVSIEVVQGFRSRLCVGLVIRLLAPLFPRHHRERWPGKASGPGATAESQNHRFKILIPRERWALRCMDGVLRALMKTKPLAFLPPVLTG